MKKTLANFIPEMVELKVGLLANPVYIQVYYVSELVQKNVVINCQAGEGEFDFF